MRLWITATVTWLEDRTGVPSAVKHFLSEDIPASAGWAQVFGSVALFLFAIQALTGILLALNYSATPDDAYRSIVYILRNVAAGHMVRGLHHWGASMMVAVVFLHMAQVFIYGAYRKPREATWLAGVCLLLFTLAFGLTGYLLPWDNRAYWGSMVTTRIMGSVPFVGTFLSKIIGFSKGIGVLTFSRFYAAHTMLLPAVTVFLIAVHVALVKRHGVTPDTEATPKSEKFYPQRALRDVVAVFVAFLLLFAAAVFVEVPLERIADATDTGYQPRPEWYFLFLFELLKFLPGQLELLGTVVLPSVAVLSLFLLPFFPSVGVRLSKSRATSAGLVLLAFGLWGGLTLSSLRTAPSSQNAAGSQNAEWANVPPEQIAGIGYFRSSRCSACHNLISGSPKEGPNLGLSSVRHPKEWLVKHFVESGKDNSPAPSLSLPQLSALAAFIENANPESAAILQSIAPQFIRGAQVYASAACATCHKVNGSGGSLGPSLNGLANRRRRDWIEQHFLNPQRLSPGSNMPSYRFSQEDTNSIVLYLLSLPQ